MQRGLRSALACGIPGNDGGGPMLGGGIPCICWPGNWPIGRGGPMPGNEVGGGPGKPAGPFACAKKGMRQETPSIDSEADRRRT